MSLDDFLHEQMKMAENVEMRIENHYHPDAIEQAYNFYHGYVRSLRVLKYPINEELFEKIKRMYQKWHEMD